MLIYTVKVGRSEFKLNPLDIPYHNAFPEINTHLKHSICSDLLVQM